MGSGRPRKAYPEGKPTTRGCPNRGANALDVALPRSAGVRTNACAIIRQPPDIRNAVNALAQAAQSLARALKANAADADIRSNTIT